MWAYQKKDLVGKENYLEKEGILQEDQTGFLEKEDLQEGNLLKAERIREGRLSIKVACYKRGALLQNGVCQRRGLIKEGALIIKEASQKGGLIEKEDQCRRKFVTKGGLIEEDLLQREACQRRKIYVRRELIG